MTATRSCVILGRSLVDDNGSARRVTLDPMQGKIDSRADLEAMLGGLAPVDRRLDDALALALGRHRPRP
jgi:hypothetical protein